MQTASKSRLTKSDIQAWLSYWKIGGLVAVDRILTLQHVYEARKYCRVMREGIFTPDAVSDGQIWDALQTMRAA